MRMFFLDYFIIDSLAKDTAVFFKIKDKIKVHLRRIHA